MTNLADVFASYTAEDWVEAYSGSPEYAFRTFIQPFNVSVGELRHELSYRKFVLNHPPSLSIKTYEEKQKKFLYIFPYTEEVLIFTHHFSSYDTIPYDLTEFEKAIDILCQTTKNAMNERMENLYGI